MTENSSHELIKDSICLHENNLDMNLFKVEKISTDSANFKVDSPISSSSLTVRSGSRNCSFSNNDNSGSCCYNSSVDMDMLLYSAKHNGFLLNKNCFESETSLKVSKQYSQDVNISKPLPDLKSISFDTFDSNKNVILATPVLLGGTPQLRKNSSNKEHNASGSTKIMNNTHDNINSSAQNASGINAPPPLQMLSTNPNNNSISPASTINNNTSVFENSKNKQNYMNLDALNRLNQVIGGYESNNNSDINTTTTYNSSVFGSQALKYADSFDSQYFRNTVSNQAVSNNIAVGRKRRASSKNKSADLVDKTHSLPNDHFNAKTNLLLNIEKGAMNSNNSHFHSIHDSDPTNYHLNDATTTATINSFIGDNHASILSNDEQITKFFNNEDKKLEQGVGLVDPFNPEDHHFDSVDKKFDGMVDLGTAGVLDMPNKQDLHSQIQHHSSNTNNQQLIDGSDFFNSLGNQHNNLNDNDILSFAINNGFHQNQNNQYTDESAPFLFNLDSHQNALNNVDPSALRFFSDNGRSYIIAPNSQLISASSDIHSQLGDSNLYNENSLLDNTGLYHHQQSSKPKKPRNRVVRDERRRNFHNEIERNRRTKINNLINGLAMLVPDLKSAIESSRGVGTSGYPSKGKILSRTVEFINELIGQCQYIEGLVNKVNSLSSELEAYKSHHSSCFQYHPNYHLKKDPGDGDNSDTTNKN